MSALVRFTRDLLRFGRAKSVPAKPTEPVYDPERPLTGFFSGLTAEQKARAAGYKGPDNYGPESPKQAN